MKNKSTWIARGLICAMLCFTLQPASVFAAENDAAAAASVVEEESAAVSANDAAATDSISTEGDIQEDAGAADNQTDAVSEDQDAKSTGSVNTAADDSSETETDEEYDTVTDSDDASEEDSPAETDLDSDEETEEETEPVQILVNGTERTVRAVTDLEAASLRVAVWSQTNAQDDIKWYTMTQQEDGSWTAAIKTNILQHSGNCFAHVYTNDNVFVGAATFTVTEEEISQNIIEITGSGSTRTASVSLADSSSAGVKVAVWSQTNAQDDIKWYTMKKQADGTWSVIIKLSNLKHTGLCYAHFYTTDNQWVGGTTFQVTSEDLPVNSVEVTKSGSDYIVTAATAENASSLKVAVWSKTDAQDDIVWTKMKQQDDGSWTSTVNLKKIMSFGTCYAHVYTSKNVFIGGTSFEVTKDELSQAKVSITGSGSTRTAKVDLDGTSISGVKVAVWSATGGQDDIKWYTLSKKSDGTYRTTIKLSNLKHTGSCYAHFYTSDNKWIGGTTFTVAEDDIPDNEITISGSGTSRSVTVTTAGSYSNAAIAVWSATGGQDDIKWYSLTKKSDGTWTGSISLTNLSHSGSVYVHCYANSNAVFLGNTTFTVSTEDYNNSRDAAAVQAANVLKTISNDLQSAFNWSASLTYVTMEESPSVASSWYAQYGFTNKKGNCYVMAATFYYLAKQLGYDAHHVHGGIASASGGLINHSWVEIDINGSTYVFDPQYHNQKGYGGYYFTYGTSGTWRYSNVVRYN